ncbi:hypothetical protein [Nocardia amamiensis]|uniref:hypothetical protein n=1 Tax=Nocardia amamiensis TaxID=404578 RepID=UPI00082D19C9|nr:hypothetical protein [Nocardia amamiensis]
METVDLDLHAWFQQSGQRAVQPVVEDLLQPLCRAGAQPLVVVAVLGELRPVAQWIRQPVPTHRERGRG